MSGVHDRARSSLSTRSGPPHPPPSSIVVANGKYRGDYQVHVMIADLWQALPLFWRAHRPELARVGPFMIFGSWLG